VEYPCEEKGRVDMVEMVVESIRVNLTDPTRVVFLREKDRERYLAIVIGIAEAEAIAIRLHRQSFPRPLTHDLLNNVISSLGAKVQSILISDLIDSTYYARIVLDQGGRHLEIDARPSDAIALAVRADVPISEAVLEVAGMTPDEEPEESAAETSGSKAGQSSDLDSKLGVFRDFINSLDLDDLDKPKG